MAVPLHGEYARLAPVPPFYPNGAMQGIPARGRVGVAAALLLAVAMAPLFTCVVPPLVDYPNHLARYAVLLRGGGEFYEIRWAPLPNLAGDVIVPALARLMPLDLAGQFFVAAIFALILGGTVWLNRMVTGGWRLWPLLAAAFLYNRQLLWGFTNYLFGLGLALCGAALWLALERRPRWARSTASSVVAVLVFFSHVAAFGIYALVIAGIELTPAFRELRQRNWRALAGRIALAAVQFAVPLAIVLASWGAVAGAGRISYAGFWRKADLLFSVFDNYSRPFDVACFALLLALFGWLAWNGRLRLAPRLKPALALVFAAYLLLPSQMLSGSGIDHRIPVALFLLLIAASAPLFPSRRAAAALGAAAGVVLLARFAMIESVWLHADRIYRADLAGLDGLPVGSKLAVAYPPGAFHAGSIPEIHLPTLALARRGIFVPTLFAIPGQQPIALRQAYAEMAAAASPTALWAAFVNGDRSASSNLRGYEHIVFTDRRPFEVHAGGCLRPVFERPSFKIFAVLQEGCT
jgi:hypothetical protein